MTALALPDPQAITPAQVSHYGAVVLQAAEATSDVHEVQDIYAAYGIASADVANHLLGLPTPP